MPYACNRRVAAGAAFAATLLSAGPGVAQPYPSQPITITVAFAAGGFADGVARLIGDRLGERLGQKVVVENKGGAGGNLGARAVAQSNPDGHAILVSTTATAINGTLYKNPGYAPGDLRAVAIIGVAPEAVVVHPGHPAKDLAELVRQAKDKPIQYATPGVGTGSYIAAEYFFRAIAKVETVPVPFTGGGPAINAVIGGHVPVLVGTLPPFVAHLNAGTMRGLGIASAKRNQAVPAVPTFAEAGFAGFQAQSWVGFFVPAKTPDAVAARLNDTINQVLRDAAVQQRLKQLGLEPMIADGTEAARFFASEADHWGKMVRTLNLSIN
jgi:tripartite-type tricarboxylate transporter receptor subunit TctC